MMSVNGRRAATPKNPVTEHPGPVSLNMVIGQKAGGGHASRQQNSRESNDTLSQLEQQVRSIEVNTMAAAKLREELSNEPDTYLRYREHEDLLDTINHLPER